MPGDEASTAPTFRDDGPPIPSDEVRRYLQHEPPDSETRDIPLLRQQTRAAGLAVRGALEPVASVTDRVVAGVATRVYQPRVVSEPHEVFVWVHGGGWMHGDLDVYDGMCRAFANALGCEVVAVDYGLAPENPFPGPLDEVWKVVAWAARTFDDVVVAGDSSGANLVAAAALRARDQGVRLAAQLLVYPMLESSDATPFKQRFRTRYSPFVSHPRFGQSTFERIAWIWEVYVPDAAQRENPLASPAHAASLAGLAPVVLVTAEHDILRGEAEDYAARLTADGVPVELLEFAGQIHGFLQLRGVFTDAARALTLSAAAVQRMVAQHPVPASRTASSPPAPSSTTPSN